MSAGVRPGLTAIADGWGSDSLDDLVARTQLLSEWWQANFPLSNAELKIARAMSRRLCELGGIAMVEIH